MNSVKEISTNPGFNIHYKIILKALNSVLKIRYNKKLII